MLEVNYENTRTMCEICSQLTIKTSEVNDVAVVPLLLTLSIVHTFSSVSIVHFELINFFWDEHNFQCTGEWPSVSNFCRFAEISIM